MLTIMFTFRWQKVIFSTLIDFNSPISTIQHWSTRDKKSLNLSLEILLEELTEPLNLKTLDQHWTVFCDTDIGNHFLYNATVSAQKC